MLVRCPYCKKELEKIPIRKTKCSNCGKFIYVRNSILLTEKGAQEVDFKKRMQENFNDFNKKYLETKEKLTKKWGFVPKEGDIIWGASNALLSDAISANDWSSAGLIYFEQSLFLYNIGKDFFRILQESFKCELRNLQKDDVLEGVEILTGRDASCSSCQKLEGKKFSIEEALEKMPIPNETCEFKLNPGDQKGWCRCTYLPVLKEI